MDASYIASVIFHYRGICFLKDNSFCRFGLACVHELKQDHSIFIRCNSVKMIQCWISIRTCSLCVNRFSHFQKEFVFVITCHDNLCRFQKPHSYLEEMQECLLDSQALDSYVSWTCHWTVVGLGFVLALGGRSCRYTRRDPRCDHCCPCSWSSQPYLKPHFLIC